MCDSPALGAASWTVQELIACPNATLTCRVFSCYMIWFPGSRRRLRSRHSPRCARSSVLQRVRSPGFTTGSMPRALICVGCGGAPSSPGTLARTRRGRLFATSAVCRRRNAGYDLGLNAQWCHDSGKPGKSGHVEERDSLADSAVQGDPAVEPFPRQDRGHPRNSHLFPQGVDDL